MRILLFGKNAKSISDLVLNFGFKIVPTKPDVVISYGGDGTLLSSERDYPQVPKLAIRDSRVCKKCPNHSDYKLLSGLSNGKLKLSKFSKLETKFSEQEFLALNDVVIRNASPIHAIRFQVKLNGKVIPPKIVIGDGVVVATPFGSSAYYQSITKKTFTKGFGLAYNNTTISLPPIFFKDEDIVGITIVRGTANLSYDNQANILEFKEKGQVEIKISKKRALIYQPDSLRCRDCKIFKDKRLSDEI